MKDKRLLVNKYLCIALSRDGDALADNVISALSECYLPKDIRASDATDNTKSTIGVSVLPNTKLDWVLVASPSGIDMYLDSVGEHLLEEDKPPRLTISHVTTDVNHVISEYCEIYAYSMCDRSINAVHRHILATGLW